MTIGRMYERAGVVPPVRPSVTGSGLARWDRPYGAYVGYLALIFYLFSPGRDSLPAAVVSTGVFIGVQLLLRANRFSAATPLCPTNIAQFLFMDQMILMPLLVVYFGYDPGTLPFLPTPTAINTALLLSTTAYVSFAVAYQYRTILYRRRPSITVPYTGHSLLAPRATYLVAGAFAGVGLIGFVFFFGSVSGYLSYLSNPGLQYAAPASTSSASLTQALATFLRPFLGFAVIVVWSQWLSRERFVRMPVRSLLVTGATLVCLLAANLNFNRGSMVMPIVALVAAFSGRVRRIPMSLMAAVGIPTAFLVILFGTYRHEILTSPGQQIPNQGVASLAAQTDLNSQLQVYGAAPQFLGYLLDASGYTVDETWGRSLLDSVLSPFPLLGKGFRTDSTVTRYNLLIYGSSVSQDQNVPFVGELFWNFHVAGIILCFFLLGLVAARLQRSFSTAISPLSAYVWCWISIWTLLLITGSSGVTSQLYLQDFWPVYVWCVLEYFRRARSAKLTLEKRRPRLNVRPVPNP